MPNPRSITFNEAILEALDLALQDDKTILIGEGVPDPKAIFGTTKGLKEKYPTQVYDSPVSEAGVAGICIGAAIGGYKAIHTHQRMDFSLYAMDQIVNNAAKWHSMFGGNSRSVNTTTRMVIGRGWGQGNQHSQNLAALYAHIPGLKVFMPSDAIQAKGLLLQAIKDPNPVIFLEHKWLQNKQDIVPKGYYLSDTEPETTKTKHAQLTLVSWGYAYQESRLAATYLTTKGIPTELVCMKQLNPINMEPILASLVNTGALCVVDDAWYSGSIAGDIIARCSESMRMDKKPIRVCYPDFPSPSTQGLTKYYYNTALDIVKKISTGWGRNIPTDMLEKEMSGRPLHDVDPYSGVVTSAI